MGLKKLMEKDEVGTVALFDDLVFKRSQHWVLSTSAIFSGMFEAYGWGEVVPNGFGVAYMTGFDGTFLPFSSLLPLLLGCSLEGDSL